MGRLTPIVEASLPACWLALPSVSVRSASFITCWIFPCPVLVPVFPVGTVVVDATVTIVITVGPVPGVFAATVPDWIVGGITFVLLLSPQAANRMSIASVPQSCKIERDFNEIRITLTTFLAYDYSGGGK